MPPVSKCGSPCSQWSNRYELVHSLKRPCNRSEHRIALHICSMSPVQERPPDQIAQSSVSSRFFRSFWPPQKSQAAVDSPHPFATVGNRFSWTSHSPVASDSLRSSRSSAVHRFVVVVSCDFSVHQIIHDGRGVTHQFAVTWIG